MPTNFGNLPSNAPISGDGLADTTVTAAKLADDVLPLGSVIDWYRPTTSTAVPTGWAICDGTAWSSIDNSMGAAKAQLTTGNIPDLIGKVTVGARLTTTAGGATPADGTASSNGNAYANAPGIGGTGGSNAAINLAHTHSIPAHGHGNNLAVSGAGANISINGAGTGISVNGSGDLATTNVNLNHGHTYDWAYGNTSTGNTGSFTRTTTVTYYTSTTSYVLGEHAHTLPNHGHGITDPTHAHGITQTNHSHNLTGSVGPNTNGDSAMTTTNLSWTSAVTDVRPAHVGMLKIMKVKV